MVEKYFGGVLPAPVSFGEHDAEIKELLVAIAPQVEERMDALDFSQALEEIWKGIRRLNKYIDETMPWVLGKEGDTDRLSTVLYNLTDGLRIISTLLLPFMEGTALKMKEQLGLSELRYEDVTVFGTTPAGSTLKKTENMFPRLDIDKELVRLDEANQKLIAERKKKKNSRKKKLKPKRARRLRSTIFRKWK